MSDHLKKHLTTQLELLDESSFHLQSSISDFVQQIKTRIMECVHDTSDINMTLKDAVVVVATAQSTILEHTDMFTESTKVYPPTDVTVEKTISESKSLKSTKENISTDSTPVESDAKTMSRLKDIETTLTSLQDTKQKTEDDISEIKQWRDNFVIEQSVIGINIDKMSKKQKQNLKNIRKQIHEKDNRVDELNKEIKDLKEKETNTDKALEKVSLDLIEYKNNLHNYNTEMQAHTDKVENLTQEIKKHSDWISAVREEGKKHHVLICKLLQQKLMPIDKMIKTYNHNSKCREGTLKKIKSLEEDVLRLSQEFQTIDELCKTIKLTEQHGGLGTTSLLIREPKTGLQKRKTSTVQGQRVSQAGWCRRKARDPTPEFLALHGGWVGNGSWGFVTFSAVERNVGNHFDPDTGEFTAPVDGLYKASLTIKPRGDRAVVAGVWHKSGDVVSRLGVVRTQDKSTEASSKFEIQMKTGDVLYLTTVFKDFECTQFSCSILGV